MSRLANLMTRGMNLVEHESPGRIKIGGVEYPCVIDYVGRREEIGAGNTRQIDVDFSVTAVIRKTVMAAAPANGTRAVVDGKRLQVMESRVDDVSVTLFLDAANK